MKRLILLRHAKSSWSNPALADYDRPLNSRGRKAAGLMADYLLVEDLFPDHVLCSSARRARETVARLVDRYHHDYRLDFRERLYMADPAILLSELQAAPYEASCVMMVGHNPGMEDFALSLCGPANPQAQALMLEKYPTAALAVIGFEAKSWEAIAPGHGTLDRFVRPSDLILHR